MIAAFDFDKTLSSRDNMLPFLRSVCGRGRVDRALVQLIPLLVAGCAYDRFRDRAKCSLLRRLLAGRAESELRANGKRFADQVTTHHLRVDVLERARWHRAQGHELVLVSASLSLYLGAVAERLGFDAALGTELEVDDAGRLTGELRGPNVRRQEKVARLERWVGGNGAFVWAYGDSAGDRELLDHADRAIRVSRRALPAPGTGEPRATSPV